MSTQQSLADCAVAVLAEIRSIDANQDTSHPMRHTVRALKRVAERIMSDAMQQASDLAYQANQIVKDYDEAEKKKTTA